MTLWIAGTGMGLGETRAVAELTASKTGMVAVAVGPPGTMGVDYAVMAAQEALRDSRHQPGEVGMLAHHVVLGADVPPLTEPAYYMHRVLGLTEGCRTVEIRTGCNPLGSVEWAKDRLRASDRYPAALITAADVWQPPVVARDALSTGFLIGDGGGAWVLSRRGGWAVVSSLAYCIDAELEGVSRGDSWGHPPLLPVDFGRRAREYGKQMSTTEQASRKVAAIRRVVGEALETAGITLADIRFVVVPHTAAWLTERDICATLGIKRDRTTWRYGRTIGHLGAADVLVGLHLLRKTLRPGDRVLVIAYGSGFTFGAAVLTVVAARGERPASGERVGGAAASGAA